LSQEDSASGIVLGKEFSTSLVLFQEAIAARLGLNATDYRCLEVIIRRGQMTAKALAEEARLTTGAITGIIDHLEKAGYVERLENPTDLRCRNCSENTMRIRQRPSSTSSGSLFRC
jgi:DNA-binding MarR family transcriptional regulator